MTSKLSGMGAADGGAMRLGRVLATLATPFLLAACSSAVATSEITGEVPEDYRKVHPIAIEENLETMDIPVGLSSTELPLATKGNIEYFARQFRQSGSGIIAVVAPSGSANQDAAAYLAVQVEDTLKGAGIDDDMIEYRVYRARPDERGAPIRIAFNRISAHTAPCLPYPDQMAENGENRNYHDFGCATQQNLAAMVASPLDLLYPRGMTPIDATRRTVMLEKYRAGETFTSDVTKEKDTTVFTGAGQ